MQRLLLRPVLAGALAATFLFTSAGCFSERSFPMNEQRMIRFQPATRALATRQWVQVNAPTFQQMLPPGQRRLLTCDDLLDEQGQTTNVFKVFGLDARRIDSPLFNLVGISQTAQAVHTARQEDFDAEWADFEPVQIPMPDGLKVIGRLAPPTGPDMGESYVVLLHGLFGTQQGSDVRNHADALRRMGHHVVVVGVRGHAATRRAYRDYPITFGVSESTDLIEIDRWLRERRGARRVGLLSFCITAQESLIAAWIDGGGAVEEDPASPIIRRLPAPSTRPAFDGGIIAICPPMNLVEYAGTLEKPYTLLQSPVRATFEQNVAQRLAEQGQPPAQSMWKLVEYELSRSNWAKQYPSNKMLVRDAIQFIDFSGENWRIGARRLEHVRTPILIIQPANDPLGSAQATAELVARVRNPNVGMMMTSGGGHTAISAMSASFNYSVIRAFFDPATAPTARQSQVWAAARSEDQLN